MTSYGEASAASSDLVGAARVQFPTAARSRSRPILAMDARVGFETVPAGDGQICRSLNEDRELPVSPKPEPKKRGQVWPITPAAIETGQPPEKVRGEDDRQRGVAARLGDFVVRAEKSEPARAPDFWTVIWQAERAVARPCACMRTA
jgi:hypothetical protein